MEKYIILEGEEIGGMMSVKLQSGKSVLMKAVNQKIEEGYIPLGGVSVTDNNTGKTYYQAMILKDALK